MGFNRLSWATRRDITCAASQPVSTFFRKIIQALVRTPPLSGPLANTEEYYDYRQGGLGWEQIKSCNGTSVITITDCTYDSRGVLLTGTPGDWFPQGIIFDEYLVPPEHHWEYEIDDSNVTADAWAHCGSEGGTAFSWIILEHVQSGDQILFAFNTALTDPNAWGLYWSPSGVFTGGSANTRPTATDEIVMPLQKPATTNGCAIGGTYSSVEASNVTSSVLALKDDYVQYFLSLEPIISWLTVPTGKRCLCCSAYDSGTVAADLTYANKSQAGHTYLSDGTSLVWAAYRSLAGASTRANTASGKTSQFDSNRYLEPIALTASDGNHGVMGFMTDRWWGADAASVRQYRNAFEYFDYGDRGRCLYTQVGDIAFPLDQGMTELAPQFSLENSEGTSTALVEYDMYGIVTLPYTGFSYLTDSTGPTFSGITGYTEGHNSIDLEFDPPEDDTCPLADLTIRLTCRWMDGMAYTGFSLDFPGDAATIDTGPCLEPETEYELRLRAKDKYGNWDSNDPDDWTTVTTTADPGVDIVAPTFGGITSAVALNENTARISWSAGSDAFTATEDLVYEIHYSTTASADFALRAVSAPGVTHHDVGLLQQGTTYYFRVRCVDEAGNRSTNAQEESVELPASGGTPEPGGGTSRLTAVSPPLQEVLWSDPETRAFDTNGSGIQDPGIQALKNVLVDVGWVVLRSSNGTTKVDGDCWTAPGAASQNAWCLLRNQNDTLQALLWIEASLYTAYFAWSPGKLYTAGGDSTRPTATDEVPVMAQNALTLVFANETSGTFVAISGARGDERYTRVLLPYSNTWIYGLFGFEHICTDLTDEELADNRCTTWLVAGYSMARTHASNPTPGYFGCTLADGTHPRLYDLNSAYVNAAPVSAIGDLDSVARASPVFVAHAAADGSATDQLYGYIPDWYWTAVRDYFTYYDAQTTWTQVQEMLFPSLGDVPYLADGGSIEVKAMSARVPGGLIPQDADPPTFAGIVSAEAIDEHSVHLEWLSGTDTVTTHDNLVYEVHCSTEPTAEFSIRAVVIGDTELDLDLLQHGVTYYFRVRCKDEAGNADDNEVEVSASTADSASPEATVESPIGTIGKSSSIVLRVTDDLSIRRVFMYVDFPSMPNLPLELVYHGDGFDPILYGDSEIETLVTNRDYRFTLVREGGWPAAPRLHVKPIDRSGNEIP